MIIKKILYYFLRERKKYKERALFLYELESNKKNMNSNEKYKFVDMGDEIKNKYLQYMLRNIYSRNCNGYNFCDFEIKLIEPQYSFDRSLTLLTPGCDDDKLDDNLHYYIHYTKRYTIESFLSSFEEIFISAGYKFELKIKNNPFSICGICKISW